MFRKLEKQRTHQTPLPTVAVVQRVPDALSSHVVQVRTIFRDHLGGKSKVLSPFPMPMGWQPTYRHPASVPPQPADLGSAKWGGDPAKLTAKGTGGAVISWVAKPTSTRLPISHSDLGGKGSFDFEMTFGKISFVSEHQFNPQRPNLSEEKGKGRRGGWASESRGPLFACLGNSGGSTSSGLGIFLASTATGRWPARSGRRYLGSTSRLLYTLYSGTFHESVQYQQHQHH